MEKDTVKVEQLIGYRVPRRIEQETILRYMETQLKKSGRLWNVLKSGCAVIDAICILALIGKEHLLKEKIVLLILAVLLTSFLFFLNNAKKSDRMLLNKVRNGDFRVLDCQAYKVDLAVDAVNDAVVYICTEEGQYCERGFCVDYLSAKEWSQRQSVSFLLMEVIGEKENYYELFTQKKLNRR